MPITLKEFKEKYNSVYSNNDLTNSQLADYYYIGLIRYPDFGNKYPLNWIIKTSPSEIKILLTGTSISKLKIGGPNSPLIPNFNRNLNLFKEYYPNSKLTAYNGVMEEVLRILFFKFKTAQFETIFINFHPKLIKYDVYNTSDFEKLKKIYLLTNPPKSDSELESVFELFYDLNPGKSFEKYFRKQYESNLRKKMPFLTMYENPPFNMYSKEIAEEAKRISLSMKKSNLEVKKHIIELAKHVNIIKKDEDGSFPDSLLLTKKRYPIIDTYNKKPQHIPYEFEIYVSPDKSFLAKFKNIFTYGTITFWSAKTAHRWLQAQDFHCWPQQLNFAVWCATSGCGVSLNENYPKLIQQFMQFHVYFTIRRILWELKIPLPDETIFSQTRNKYNKIALAKLCQEFNLPPPNNDFRWKHGENHGIGTVFLKTYGNWREAAYETGLMYWPNTHNTPIFNDEHGIGGQVGKIVNEAHGGKQHEWFSPNKGIGLTKPGLGRLNSSIESFLYCVAGAEVNARSSIVDQTGGEERAIKSFLQLF